MCGRVTDIKGVGDTPGRRDTAVATTGLGIISTIFAVVINTRHFSIKSWPQMKGKQCRDEEELKGPNSAPSQAVLIHEASALTAWGCLCAPTEQGLFPRTITWGRMWNTLPTVYAQGGNGWTEAQCSLRTTIHGVKSHSR